MHNSRVRNAYPKVDSAHSRVRPGFLHSSSGEAIMECHGSNRHELERAEPQFDLRSRTFQLLGVDLTQIDGALRSHGPATDGRDRYRHVAVEERCVTLPVVL